MTDRPRCLTCRRFIPGSDRSISARCVSCGADNAAITFERALFLVLWIGLFMSAGLAAHFIDHGPAPLVIALGAWAGLTLAGCFIVPAAWVSERRAQDRVRVRAARRSR